MRRIHVYAHSISPSRFDIRSCSIFSRTSLSFLPYISVTPLDVMADHHILLVSLSPSPCVANPAPFCSTFLLLVVVVLFFISPSAFTHLRVYPSCHDEALAAFLFLDRSVPLAISFPSLRPFFPLAHLLGTSSLPKKLSTDVYDHFFATYLSKRREHIIPFRSNQRGNSTIKITYIYIHTPWEVRLILSGTRDRR